MVYDQGRKGCELGRCGAPEAPKGVLCVVQDRVGQSIRSAASVEGCKGRANCLSPPPRARSFIAEIEAPAADLGEFARVLTAEKGTCAQTDHRAVTRAKRAACRDHRVVHDLGR
mgnify:CR=1 FL=1